MQCVPRLVPRLPGMQCCVSIAFLRINVTLTCACLSHVAAGAFKHDTKLEVLKLGWCKVGGGEGARALADLLMFNSSLLQVRQPSHVHMSMTVVMVVNCDDWLQLLLFKANRQKYSLHNQRCCCRPCMLCLCMPPGYC
jgi:hypothetical protein